MNKLIIAAVFAALTTGANAQWYLNDQGGFLGDESASGRSARLSAEILDPNTSEGRLQVIVDVLRGEGNDNLAGGAQAELNRRAIAIAERSVSLPELNRIFRRAEAEGQESVAAAAYARINRVFGRNHAVVIAETERYADALNRADVQREAERRDRLLEAARRQAEAFAPRPALPPIADCGHISGPGGTAGVDIYLSDLEDAADYRDGVENCYFRNTPANLAHFEYNQG